MEKDNSSLVQLLSGMLDFLKSKDSPEQPEQPSSKTIMKQFDEEEMIAIEPLYIAVGEADSYGDGMTKEELLKLVQNFNKNIDNIQGNIHHQYMTEAFKPVQAFLAPSDIYIGDPAEPDTFVIIPKGQPIVEVQFANTEMGRALWEKRKAGEVKGVSIGAMAVRVDNPDYEGDD